MRKRRLTVFSYHLYSYVMSISGGENLVYPGYNRIALSFGGENDILVIKGQKVKSDRRGLTFTDDVGISL